MPESFASTRFPFLLPALALALLLLPIAPSLAAQEAEAVEDEVQCASLAYIEEEGHFTIYQNEEALVRIEHTWRKDGSFTGHAVLTMAGQTAEWTLEVATGATGQWTTIESGSPLGEVVATREGNEAVVAAGDQDPARLTLRPGTTLFDNYQPALLRLVIAAYDREAGGEQQIPMFIAAGAVFDVGFELLETPERTVGGDDLRLIRQLPTLGPGQFQLVCPDVSREPVPLQSRWLYSDHGAPFNEDQVEQHTPDTLREWAAERSSGRQRRRSGTGAAAAALGRVDRRKLELEEEGFTGMAAAARGSVDDEGVFDVQLMGGLSVLRDGRDPLYVMQGFTNTGSALVLLWSMIALLLQWHDGELVWFWALAGFLITTIVGLVVGLDLFLNHDAELQQKINHFARHYQYGLAAWLWLLLLWHRDPWAWWDFSLGTWLGTALEITTVWVTLFIVLEAVHRIRLGRLEMSIAGDGILGKLRSGVKSLSAVLTEGEIHDMRASARQVMEGLRWGLDFCTLLLFAYVVLSSLMGDLGDALGGDGLPRLVHPALWLGSIYLLLFLAETTIRRRAVEA